MHAGNDLDSINIHHFVQSVIVDLVGYARLCDSAEMRSLRQLVSFRPENFPDTSVSAVLQDVFAAPLLQLS